MKKMFMVLCAIQLSSGLPAQKSDLFEYDHGKLDSAMYQINVSTSMQKVSPFAVIDTTAAKPKSNGYYFMLGALSGCILPMTGCLISELRFPRGFWVAPVIGGITGFMIPGIVVGSIKQDSEASFYTCLGSGITTSLSFGLILLYYELNTHPIL